MEKLEIVPQLPTFSGANYHEDWPHGARFMLFQGPDDLCYVRISTDGMDSHYDIVKRFRREVGIEENQFYAIGGGFYKFRRYDCHTDELLKKPVITFKGSSVDYGRFKEEKLRITLLQANFDSMAEFTIED